MNAKGLVRADGRIHSEHDEGRAVVSSEMKMSQSRESGVPRLQV